MELKDAKINKYNDDELLYIYSKVENFVKYLDSEYNNAQKMEEEKAWIKSLKTWINKLMLIKK